MTFFRWMMVLAGLGIFASGERLSAQAPQEAEDDPKGVEFFEARIRPILVKHCYECHSAEAVKVRGGLLLDSREGLRRGGDTGLGLVSGKPDDSLLIQALNHKSLKMPPSKKLPDHVLADFSQWVKMGAPDPRTRPTKAAYKTMTLEAARSFWSFQPPAPRKIPQVKESGWPKSELDGFVLAALEARGLKPVADAEAGVLIRRLYFDLIGLPPAPEEVDVFVRAPSSAALEKLVDGLLASPHFGERWGRHWLDLARYAESNGSMINTPFRNAWRYRDYVIRALNQDRPYDRFLQEQLAGDLLAAETAAQRDDNLIATGFLALTCKPPREQNVNYLMDLIADQVDVTSRVFLGLSVACARCHDHKFDPIPTRDYYALAGIFNSTRMLHGGDSAREKPEVWNHVLSDKSLAMGVRENKPGDATICIGGSSLQAGPKVPRGFLQAVRMARPIAIDPKQSGRLELAQWLTQTDNPLTARVAVNRIWAHLFGRGIVSTTDNFGALGQPPSHPELLDYLAVRFVGNGWSLKKLIRTIVLSRTYQLSSQHDEAGYQADPDNVLLWRMSLRRLEAEALRDAMLAVSGKLERRPPLGTLSFSAKTGRRFEPRTDKDEPETNHRSIYLGIDRGRALPEFLAVFDAANPHLVVSQRSVTTVPNQATYLLNSSFVKTQARHLAERLLALPSLNESERINAAYRLALARSATSAEQQRALAFLRRSAEGLGAKDINQPTVWTGFCQVLLACAEFRYLA